MTSYNSGMSSWQHVKQNSSRNQQVVDGSGDLNEMHLKMSKKIAQLTKVVYALNTRNDEHENVISLIKEKHEEEIQKLLATSASKLKQIISNNNEDNCLKREVENLQQQLANHEQDKKSSQKQIDEMRNSHKEKEQLLEQEHVQTIESFTRQLAEVKRKFESKMVEMQGKVERADMARKDDQKSQELKRQVAELKRKLDSQELTFAKRLSEAEDEASTSMRQISDMEVIHEQHVTRVQAECDEKVAKCRDYYQHELDVLNNEMQKKEGENVNWKQKEQEIKVEQSKMEARYQKKVEELKHQLSTCHVDIKQLNSALQGYMTEASQNNNCIQDLNKELRSLQTKYDDVIVKNNVISSEIDSLKMKVKNQLSEITQKSSIIGTLEAIKTTQDETIQDLEEQLEESKTEKKKIEEVYGKLKNERQSNEDVNMRQLQQLAVKIDRLETERDKTKVANERQVNDLTKQHNEEVMRIHEENQSYVNKIIQQHQDKLNNNNEQAEHNYLKLRSELTKSFDKEKSQIENSSKEKFKEVEIENNQLKQNIEQLKGQIASLTNEIKASVKTDNQNKNELDSTKSKLETTLKQLEELKHKFDQSQNVIEKLKKDFEKTVSDEKLLKNKSEQKILENIQKIKKQKDLEWEKIMKSQLSDQRNRLTIQLNVERRNAVEEIDKENKSKVLAMKEGWEGQIKTLTSQISEIKSLHRHEKTEFERTVRELKSNLSRMEVKNEKQEMLAEKTLNQEIERLQDEFSIERKNNNEQRIKEINKTIEKLSSKHREELHSQMLAHQCTISSLKDQLDQEHELELSQKEQELNMDLDEIKTSLMQRNADEIDEIKLQYKNQISDLNKEILSVKERTQIKEAKLNEKISELNSQLEKSKTSIKEIELNTKNIKDENITLHKELELKVTDVLQARSEANLEIKRREEEIRKACECEINEIEAKNLRSKQEVVNEFNRATALLRDKINHLNLEIEELEDRYERRESREEDIEMIVNLKLAVEQKEEQIQQIMVDTKYYKMELVNRETNYNKVFNSNPNVGVLNPRAATKKKKNGSMKVPSANFQSKADGRLEPLSRHSSPINSVSSMQPPPLPKKVVRSSYVPDYLSAGKTETEI